MSHSGIQSGVRCLSYHACIRCLSYHMYKHDKWTQSVIVCI